MDLVSNRTEELVKNMIFAAYDHTVLPCPNRCWKYLSAFEALEPSGKICGWQNMKRELSVAQCGYASVVGSYKQWPCLKIKIAIPCKRTASLHYTS